MRVERFNNAFFFSFNFHFKDSQDTKACRILKGYEHTIFIAIRSMRLRSPCPSPRPHPAPAATPSPAAVATPSTFAARSSLAAATPSAALAASLASPKYQPQLPHQYPLPHHQLGHQNRQRKPNVLLPIRDHHPPLPLSSWLSSTERGSASSRDKQISWRGSRPVWRRLQIMSPLH